MKRNAAIDSRAPLAPSLDVAVNDGVQFSFDVTNASARKLELLFNDGRTHDIVVLDTLGREVWRWSEGRMFTQAVQMRVLRASDTLRFAESWRDRSPDTTWPSPRCRRATIPSSSASPSSSSRSRSAAVNDSAAPSGAAFVHSAFAGLLAGSGEAVAHAAHRMEMPRPLRLALEALPQLHDEVVDRA